MPSFEREQLPLGAHDYAQRGLALARTVRDAVCRAVDEWRASLEALEEDGGGEEEEEEKAKEAGEAPERAPAEDEEEGGKEANST